MRRGLFSLRWLYPSQEHQCGIPCIFSLAYVELYHSLNPRDSHTLGVHLIIVRDCLC
jgi:hypothetical protein